MKNQFIIPSIIIAAAILSGFWMLKGPLIPPEISIIKAAEIRDIKAIKLHIAAGTDVNLKDEYGNAIDGQSGIDRRLWGNFCWVFQFRALGIFHLRDSG